MTKLILAALAVATAATPLAATAADAQVRRTVIVERGPHGRDVRRVVVVRHPGHRWEHRRHYEVRRVVTRYR